MYYNPERITSLLKCRFPGRSIELIRTTVPDRPYQVSDCIEALHSTTYWHFTSYWQAYEQYRKLTH